MQRVILLSEQHVNHIVSVTHSGTEAAREDPGQPDAILVPGEVREVRCQECDAVLVPEIDWAVEPADDSWDAGEGWKPDEHDG